MLQFFVDAIPDGKPFHTFPGIAPVFVDAIPDGKPFHTFPGIAPVFVDAIPDGNRFTLFLELLRFLLTQFRTETVSHLSWNCSGPDH
ncbi:hypothetical protein, partial [Mesorhizobium sp. M1C.F.Ca.ET.212.01.1.1]|uniref:hypothetical protein n=1 Tax=Mesorhizobium sp. M1C.F.Ca.ET.212.01.1.1 TaxID=2500527 RepID=UPI001AED8C50